MDVQAFHCHFEAAEELGRFIMDSCILIFRDNGRQVGVLRENLFGPNTAEVLCHEEAMSARMWWMNQECKCFDLASPRSPSHGSHA